jgi:hypothetical protein
MVFWISQKRRRFMSDSARAEPLPTRLIFGIANAQIMQVCCPARSPGAVPPSHRSALRLERKSGPVRCMLPVCVAHRRHGGQSTGAKGARSASAVPIGAQRRPLAAVRRSVVPAMGDANGRFRARKARLGLGTIPSRFGGRDRPQRAGNARLRRLGRAVRGVRVGPDALPGSNVDSFLREAVHISGALSAG